MKATQRFKWLGLAVIDEGGFLCCKCRHFEVVRHYDPYGYGHDTETNCLHPLLPEYTDCLAWDDYPELEDCWMFCNKESWKAAAKERLTPREAEELYWLTVSRVQGFWCGPKGGK